MWLFTQYGFYSVVSHYDNPKRLVVRARWRGDLVRLETLIPAEIRRGLQYRIESTPKSDYPFRVELNREVFTQVMEKACDEIEYTNFKARALATLGRAIENVFMRVWVVMRENENADKQPEKPKYGLFSDVVDQPFWPVTGKTRKRNKHGNR
jgi:hypothetical protein